MALTKAPSEVQAPSGNTRRASGQIAQSSAFLPVEADLWVDFA